VRQEGFDAWLDRHAELPPPDSPAAIAGFVRAFAALREPREIEYLVNTELVSLYSVNSSSKFIHGARLRRLTGLALSMGSELVENPVYRSGLRLLRFHRETYLPSAQADIAAFALVFSQSKTPDTARNLAGDELNQVYRFITGRVRTKDKKEPRDPLERIAYSRKLAIVTTLLSMRRTALRSVLGDEIALPDNPSHYAKGYLVLALERAEYICLRHHNEDVMNVRRENQMHVHDTLRYLGRAIELIRSDDAIRVIAGLIALTGRRPVEVASMGAISKLEGEGSDYCVAFRGQAKTRARAGTMHGAPFPIPVLCAPYIVLDAWKHLRNSPRGREIALMPPVEFNRRLGWTLGYVVGVEFSDHLRGGRAKAQPKDLRGIYAEICNQIYNGDALIGRRIMDNGLYYSKILGHGLYSGQVSDYYKAFILDDLPAEPDPRPLPMLKKPVVATIKRKRKRPPGLHGLSKLGAPRKPPKKAVRRARKVAKRVRA
jgi:hypothetical protein